MTGWSDRFSWRASAAAGRRAATLLCAGALLAVALGPDARAQRVAGPCAERPFAAEQRALPASPRAALLAASSPPCVRPDTARRAPADAWWAMDKAKHAGGSFLLVLGGQYVFEMKAGLGRDPALALALGTGAAVGVAKEVYDRFLGATRYFSARDLVADALGLLLGAGVVLL